MGVVDDGTHVGFGADFVFEHLFVDGVVGVGVEVVVLHLGVGVGLVGEAGGEVEVLRGEHFNS